MKLVNINKNGTQKFQLKDGRFILSYNSGYVRIDSGLDRLYQINKTKKVYEDRECWTGEIIKMEYTERILIPCPSERFQYIVDWVNRNVKDVPYALTRKIKNQYNLLEYYRKQYDH